MASQSRPGRFPLMPLLLFSLLAVGIVVLGWVWFRRACDDWRRAAEENLAAIGDLKVRQIVTWRRAQLGHAAIIAHNPLNAHRLLPFLENPSATDSGDDIRAWLELLRQYHDCSAVLLTDAHGRLRVAAGPEAPVLGDAGQAMVADALHTGQPVLHDIHVEPGMDVVHLDLCAPIRRVSADGSTGPGVGVLVFRIDPARFLYPLIQDWPTSSSTGETLLVRREADHVVFLNELRYRKGTALTLRFPITQENLPAAAAVRGYEGILQGCDYRGVEVLSVLRRVPDSPWFMVAKMDLDEIEAPLRARLRLIVLAAAVLILATGALFLLWWTRTQTGFYRRQYEIEAAAARLQTRLAQAQRLQSIGRLAGGVAHDFNNMLQAILGYLGLALKGLPAESSLRADLVEVEKAAHRAADLTRQLLAFGRQQVLETRLLDLNTLVSDMDRLLRRLIGEDITVTTVLQPGLGAVRADAAQIEQVLMNLAVNARDAMPAGGRLTIETADIVLDETYARTHPEVKPGAYVMLAVSDTGCGMDAETINHLFEPFFTTKAKDKGTGLGLAIVYGIVKQHGGHVSVYSEPGQGTTFKVYLPRATEAGPPPAPRPAPPASLAGTECVLVLEDDAAVRRFVCRGLRDHGYSVLEAATPDLALQAASAGQPIDLLVTDVVMPGMSGRQAYEQLLTVQPRLKVLFMSGYTDNVIVHHGVLAPDVHFLAKPFTTTRLLEKVREALAAPHSNQ